MNLPRLGRAGAPGAALRSAAVLVLLGGFMLHARHFGFIQDDSFITFRYIRNFLAGNGLVFNIGEHVEGYTTFLWLILLALAAKVGLNLVPASQIIGLAFGAASLLLTIRLSRETGPPERGFWFSLIAAGLLAANGAVAYWSGSGMETALFTFLTLCCILSYVSENRKGGPGLRTALLFFLLSLTRPEGMMMFGITMGYSLLEGITGASGRRTGAVKRVLLCSAFYLVPTGIFLLWRISYYGFIFPNTFYAKAGISKEYFNAGTDYFLLFADKYLLGGALLLAPIGVLIARRFDRVLLYVFVLFASYTLYVIVVGGDVLPAFRFFIPVIPIVYLFVQEAIYELYRLAEVKKSMNYAVAGLLLLVALVTVVRPYEYLRNAWMGENALVTKMAQTGKWIRGHSAPSAVVAGSTIGALSYYSEDTLVDMLGLTDETIAHHPETIPGVKSSWRERSYNTTYLLSRKPEWICFSTGIKPSAFAERALFTREEFRRWYYPYLFHPGGDAAEVNVMYRRSEAPRPDSSVPAAGGGGNEFVNYYYEGVNLKRHDPQKAMEYFQRALAEAPPDFALLYQDIADLYASTGDQRAAEYYEKALMLDPRLVQSHVTLAGSAVMRRDFESAERHLQAVVRLDPDWSGGWALLGTAYDSAGSAAQAASAYRMALRVAPNDSGAYYALRRVQQKG